MGVELVVATCLGGGLGWLADRKLGSLPWLTFLGVVLGIAAGIRNTLRLARELEDAGRGGDGPGDGPPVGKNGN
jgi:ATP synthase protein I